jgi:hypothetical protein
VDWESPLARELACRDCSTQEVAMRSLPVFPSARLAVFAAVAVGCFAVPAMPAVGAAGLRSLSIVSNNGDVLVIGMFESAARRFGRVPCARNALAAGTPIPGLGASLIPASSSFAYCEDPTNKTCRRDCQSCQLGQDVSLDEMSCGGPPSYICWQAGECLLTPNNRCCLECTYSCYGSCLDCPAPLRCRYVR